MLLLELLLELLPGLLLILLREFITMFYGAASRPREST